jgi:dTDP-4-amino-4,6-dideoxygalactose transaminase
MKILNLKPGDEVIVPNLTFIATINSVIMANLKPVLCEVDEECMCMNIESFKSSITNKTKAVIPVHSYENCCDMSQLKKINI